MRATPAVQPVTADELEAAVPILSELLRESVGADASLGFLPPLSTRQAREYWLSLKAPLAAGSRVLLAASLDGRIVGSGQLSLASQSNARHRATLEKLFVQASARGRGIGKLLVGALEDAARRHGCTLLLLGARRNDPAEDFYRRLGYQEYGIIPGYSRDARGRLHDNVCFYRELGID